MCGIVGVISHHDISPLLIEGLKRLEYRGYDSAGVAVITPDQKLQRYRTTGKVERLEQLIKSKHLHGHIGIAHTRWATHGKVNENNAHPHFSGDHIAIVHNGIIENYLQLRDTLLAKGFIFQSETDSEVVAHLIADYLAQKDDFLGAVQATLKQLEGSYALGFLNKKDPERLIVASSGSPVVIGKGERINFFASDYIALLPFTSEFIYLEAGDLAEIKSNIIIIYDKRGQMIERPARKISSSKYLADKGEYAHFMQKEIFEQPSAVSAALEGRLDLQSISSEMFDESAKVLLKKTQRIQIIGCGTSYHAGLVGRYWVEKLLRIPCQVDIASEFRYRNPIIEPGTLLVTLSQSGETADTIGALGSMKTSLIKPLGSLAICNVMQSTLVRESDYALFTRAGPEIGVASTKAFETQLVTLLLLTLAIGLYTERLDPSIQNLLIQELRLLPKKIEQTLALAPIIKTIAKHLISKDHALYLGRTLHFPIALEGALKLKELSYIHAEAYPAGELKHGPLALVDAQMPVIVLAPHNELVEKINSNVQELAARNAEIFIVTDGNGWRDKKNVNAVIEIPSSHNLISPLLYTIPLQLLAYYVAVLKGTDVDQPRNLAKSVTVE